ncbi:MAG: hypothetical protein GWM98_02540 [Nitrospinaceae bacterium]|nr:hypothetical protein [Nitrospinaceae bacterium]NIR53583.1 hypothetical protein [Nitrospinaceae bacterium]NIS83984.1 hypothetical protein [Nitrospinaceae bacterium]NIT80793.1 hypothetical protein [Nitrospinaceae bacterium]NIU43099.1 hypothetical protein [Nitrospinaceae bacterium]
MLLRFEGVYQSGPHIVAPNTRAEQTYWHYLRFYEDQTVLTVSSVGSPENFARWFRKENYPKIYFSLGGYYFEEGQIKFSSTSREGVVDYEGTILKDGLRLKTFSHITGRSSQREYHFISLPSR